MSSLNVSNSVFSSPNQVKSEIVDSQSSTAEIEVLSHIRYEHKIEQLLNQSQKEAHQKRMQSLRKEIDFLNNTAWQFENPEKNNTTF